MITSGAVPAPLPAHIGVSQISWITTRQDVAGSLAGVAAGAMGGLTRAVAALPWRSARLGPGSPPVIHSLPPDRKAGWSAICARIESGHR